MPHGVGFELVLVTILLAILLTTFAVARLGPWERTSETGEPTGVTPGGFPQDEALVNLTGDEVHQGQGPRTPLVGEVARFFRGDASLSLPDRLAVVLVVGARASGTTTMVGKLAYRLVNRGRLVALTACDPSRAGPGGRLAAWAERTGAELIAPEPASDPGAAAYGAVEVARARGFDVLIVDAAFSAGEIEGSVGELARVRRLLEKAAGQVDEVLLVVDARRGPGPIPDIRPIIDAAGVTGIALSNLDRGADPGSVLAVQDRLGIPVKLLGTGERVAELRAYDADWFAWILANMEGARTMATTRGSVPGASAESSAAAES
jgi:signal recognition particle GTPase